MTDSNFIRVAYLKAGCGGCHCAKSTHLMRCVRVLSSRIYESFLCAFGAVGSPAAVHTSQASTRGNL